MKSHMLASLERVCLFSVRSSDPIDGDDGAGGAPHPLQASHPQGPSRPERPAADGKRARDLMTLPSRLRRTTKVVRTRFAEAYGGVGARSRTRSRTPAPKTKPEAPSQAVSCCLAALCAGRFRSRRGCALRGARSGRRCFFGRGQKGIGAIRDRVRAMGAGRLWLQPALRGGGR